METTREVGFTNGGNACYLNAIAQCVLENPHVQRELASTAHTATCESPPGKCLDCAILALWQQKRALKGSGPLCAEELRRHLVGLNRNFSVNGQEDAMEALETLIANSRVLQGLFRSRLMQTLQCDTCGAPGDRQPCDDFSHISHAPGDMVSDIQHLVSDFCSPESVERRCATCSRPDVAGGDAPPRNARFTKNMHVVEWAKVLVVHIKRFACDTRGALRKSRKRVAASERLLLGGAAYQLDSIVEHKGEVPQSGHYVCYTRGGQLGWALRDDAFVTDKSAADALRCQTYIAFYSMVERSAAAPEPPLRAPAGSPPIRPPVSREPSSRISIVGDSNALGYPKKRLFGPGGWRPFPEILSAAGAFACETVATCGASVRDVSQSRAFRNFARGARPDAIICCLGTNDLKAFAQPQGAAEFAEKFGELVEILSLRLFGAMPVLVLGPLGNSPRTASARADMGRIMRAAVCVARAAAPVAFCDPAEVEGYQQDHVHLDGTGHGAIALRLQAALLALLDASHHDRAPGSHRAASPARASSYPPEGGARDSPIRNPAADSAEYAQQQPTPKASPQSAASDSGPQPTPRSKGRDSPDPPDGSEGGPRKPAGSATCSPATGAGTNCAKSQPIPSAEKPPATGAARPTTPASAEPQRPAANCPGADSAARSGPFENDDFCSQGDHCASDHEREAMASDRASAFGKSDEADPAEPRGNARLKQKCPDCSLVMAKKNLARHKKRAHSSVDTKLPKRPRAAVDPVQQSAKAQCPLCPAQVIRQNLRRHAERVHGREAAANAAQIPARAPAAPQQGRACCPHSQCKKWVTKRALPRHVRRIHSSGAPRATACVGATESCPICRTAVRAPYLQKHLLRAHRVRRAKGVNARRQARQAQVECPTCSVHISRRNLARHVAKCHAPQGLQNVANAICVDETAAIFMVRNSPHGGVGYPIHVRLSAGFECDSNDCMDIMRRGCAVTTGGAQCRHVRVASEASLGGRAIHNPIVELTLAGIMDIGPSGSAPLLKEETVTLCAELRDKAIAAGASPVVLSREKRYIHASVFDGGSHYYGKFGRVAVTADAETGDVDCGCCNRPRGCVHKAMLKWHLLELGELDGTLRGFATGNDSGEERECHASRECRPSEDGQEAEPSRPVSAVPDYPPEEGALLCRMVDYVAEHKRVPFARQRRQSPNVLAEYAPPETQCHYCAAKLAAPSLVTEAARVVTMDAIHRGVRTCYKKCPSCSTHYRYQECVDAVHNYDDTTLVGYDVLEHLRDSLRAHVSIGTALQILESKLGERIDVLTVHNAFAQYEALCDRPGKNAYNCAICGVDPPILVTDGNRKVAFDYAPDLASGKLASGDMSDEVDAAAFWSRVDRAMVSRGFTKSGKIARAYEIQPSLSNWAPYIAPLSRKSEIALNTEWRKVAPGTGELEVDCRDMSVERIHELLNLSAAREVQAFARSIGCAPRGSKEDVLSQLRNSIQSDGQMFTKAFKKAFGASGGWISFVCPHSVVYALKFIVRCEGPRDYLDILLSLRHPPAALIVDMPQMIAAHAAKRAPGFFRPHGGMVAEPTVENIEAARAGHLAIDLPWLAGAPAQDAGGHPVTGSAARLLLFDRFHQGNSNDPAQAMRRVDNVVQLRGAVNTEACEQLHRSCNQDAHFLNKMDSAKHIFFHRLLIDMRNDSKNKALRAAGAKMGVQL